MTATDAQVRIMMKERVKGHTQEQAAARANLKSCKTAAKYEKLGRLPSEMKEPRRCRTRRDAFAEDWAMVEEMLGKLSVGSWSRRLQVRVLPRVPGIEEAAYEATKTPSVSPNGGCLRFCALT